MDTNKKEEILVGLTAFLDEATVILLDGSPSADVKKWRNRLVALPQMIREGKVKNEKEAERYIQIALKAALMSDLLQQQKDMIKLFARVISAILKTLLVTV